SLLLLAFPSPASSPLAIYTLSLHDALPILQVGDHIQAIVAVLQQRPVAQRAEIVAQCGGAGGLDAGQNALARRQNGRFGHRFRRSEEHTSELQSRFDLVCRLLLDKIHLLTE